MLQHIHTVDHLVAVNVIEHIKRSLKATVMSNFVGYHMNFHANINCVTSLMQIQNTIMNICVLSIVLKKRGIFQCPYCPATFKYL